MRRHCTNPNWRASYKTSNQYSKSAVRDKDKLPETGGLGGKTKYNVGSQIQFYNRKILMLAEKLMKSGHKDYIVNCTAPVLIFQFWLMELGLCTTLTLGETGWRLLETLWSTFASFPEV